MKLVASIIELIKKSGVNKGDATSGTVVGGISLGVMFVLFVSMNQYHRDLDRQVLENTKLWHQVHVIQDYCNQSGIFIPNEDDNFQTNQSKKIKP